MQSVLGLLYNRPLPGTLSQFMTVEDFRRLTYFSQRVAASFAAGAMTREKDHKHSRQAPLLEVMAGQAGRAGREGAP